MNIKHYFYLFLALYLIDTPQLQAQDITDELKTLPPVVNLTPLPEVEMLPDVKIQKKTHPEKILFTQLKLAKKGADIDKFARISPFVQKAQEIDKSAMILSEYNRISNSFNMHAEKANIVVHTVLETDEYSSLQNLIVFDELNDKTFFKFKMYDENIGVVPQDIQKFAKLALSKVKAERMFKEIGGSQKILAEFILKPVYADRKKPITINETDFWLMFARIAEFRIWSDSDPKDAKLIWYYRAPWYSTEDKSNIGGLYATE